MVNTWEIKVPCEFTVWHILPSVRKEIVRELVETYGLSQTEVARRLDITDAAVSQYFKEKRGKSRGMEESSMYDDYRKEIRRAAGRIMEGHEVVAELSKYTLFVLLPTIVNKILI